jgi:hypothetical protein
VAGYAQFTVRPRKPVTGLTMRGWRPDQSGDKCSSAEITVKVDGKIAATATVDDGLFDVRVTFDQPFEASFAVEIDCQPVVKLANDDRALAFVLIEMRAEHD